MLAPFYKSNCVEAGCDEAGRGCLAGPVVAAAVILPAGFNHPLLNDSKKINEKTRNLLRPIIIEAALSYGIGIVTHEEIDQINILNASFKAMHLAVNQLNQKPEHLIIDGNRFNPYPDIAHTCIVKGDAKFQSIAAASVLAKCHRDDLMAQLHESFPFYDWHKNKGYPTKRHRAAIALYGPSEIHRKTFNLLPPPSLFE